MKKAILVAMLALALCGCDSDAIVLRHDRYDRFICDGGRAYIITDTETGVQYIGWLGRECGHGGGICVLVDQDGKPILAGDAE